MEISKDSYPLRAKHPIINKQFANWWLFLNTAGIFSFLLFLSCLGTGENKYFCAALSSSLYIWVLSLGKIRFPKFSKKLRESNDPLKKEFDKEIWRENFPLFLVPITHWPYWLGTLSLLSLALVPLFITNDISQYYPRYFHL